MAPIAQKDEEKWQVRRVSNPQPPVLETGALPIELLTFYKLRFFPCSFVIFVFLIGHVPDVLSLFEKTKTASLQAKTLVSNLV